MKQSEIMMRYLKEFVIAMLAYIIVVVVSNSLLINIPSRTVTQFLVAVVPVVPVVPVAFILRAILRLLMASDELQQRIQLYAFSFAAITMGLLTFSYGFLEGIGYPHMNPVWILPIMSLLWGIGLVYFSRRYR